MGIMSSVHMHWYKSYIRVYLRARMTKYSHCIYSHRIPTARQHMDVDHTRQSAGDASAMSNEEGEHQCAQMFLIK